jgi:Glycosyl hydrolase family 79 C-terminal beta domain
MHQGTDYRYAAWQPIPTSNTTIGTKPPYYGNIAVASMLGDLTTTNVSITNIPMAGEFESAYAAYVNEQLARVAVINLVEYNYTTGVGTRPTVTYNISIPSAYAGSSAGVQRLMANGSNAITGITWDGYSYNWELDEGKPVLLTNVTRGETVQVGQGGQLQVVLPYSSMVIINLSR